MNEKDQKYFEKNIRFIEEALEATGADITRNGSVIRMDCLDGYVFEIKVNFIKEDAAS